MEFFSFYIPTFVFAAINLVILYFILKKLLFVPVAKFMENRTQTIKNNIETAERERAEASQMKQEYEARLKAARDEADKIIANARVKGEEQYNSIIASAQQEAEALLEEAREKIAAERRQMFAELRNQVASLALAAASKVIEANMNTEINKSIVERFIDEEGAA
jgi:F-type H+-transporting ATPase subunit b